MKIIHCADLHLDSKMDTRLSKADAEIRRNELLMNLNRLFEYAKENLVTDILISGDLFDTERTSEKTVSYFLDCVKNAPFIRVFYLRGNHDRDVSFGFYGNIPGNLYLFGGKPGTYETQDNVTVSGLELEKAVNPEEELLKLSLPEDKYNIVMLHGQIGDTYKKSKGADIPLKMLAGKNIDYLALGHIHGRIEGRLDARGVYVYPGTPEGRGFDECGEHGFYLLESESGTENPVTDIPETRDKTFTFRFIPFEKRKTLKVECNLGGTGGDYETLETVKKTVKAFGASEQDLIKVIFKGVRTDIRGLNLKLISQELKRMYFAVSVDDETVLKPDFSAFRNSVGLKGELVRLVENSDLLENEKMEVLCKAFELLKDTKK